MIHSMFIINTSSEIVMEKHWKSVTHRSVFDFFFDILKNMPSANMPPVMPTPGNQYLIQIYRSQLHFVAVTQSEISPLFVVEFLHRVVDTVKDYFSECNEQIIRDNYVMVYELLDEMLDNGLPFATEANILKELIKPPTIFRTITNTMTGKSNVSDTLPSGQISNVPWRKANVKYANNEAYFDIIEELDVIIDKSGSIVVSEIHGNIECCVKLSGMPDLCLSFVNPRLFDEVSFHPCVRHRRWESEKVLSFIPPDGNFRLMSYQIKSASNVGQLPVHCRHHIAFREYGGKIELQLSQRNTMGRPVDLCSVEIVMPKSVLNVNLNVSQGKYTFDSATKLLVWDLGRIDGKQPCARGTISLQSGAPLPDCTPNIILKFTINQASLSGLGVNRLDMYGEKYKPFKGVKYITKTGNYQIRT